MHEKRDDQVADQANARPLRRDDLIKRLRDNVDRLKTERVAVPRDGFVAAVVHFALSLDAVGMYPPKL